MNDRRRRVSDIPSDNGCWKPSRARAHRQRISGLLATLLLLSLLAADETTAQRREVVGYYPAWQYAARDTLVTPLRLPYDKLTVINYAFFIPDADGRLAGRNPDADELILLGARDPVTGVVRGETALCPVARARGVKVVLSLGGWDGSTTFPGIAASPERRRTLAGSCADAVRRYGFDGIDIDWEYPGYEGHNGTPQDGENYLLLLREVRDTLDALGRVSGNHLLLTIAVATTPDQAKSFDVSKALKYLDFVNLMTYDYYGAWDPLSNHNVPLYPSEASDPARCVDAGFRLYHETYGIPADKLNIGTAFYGRTYKACNALRAPHGGSDEVHFPPEGTPHYYTLAGMMDRCSRRWDEKAKAPYLVCEEWNSLVSFDDDSSTTLKAQYAVDHGIRGIIIWEITGDFFPDGSTPLLDAIHRVFTAGKPAK
jgi:chitinase